MRNKIFLFTILYCLTTYCAFAQRKFVVSEIWTKPSGDSTIIKNLVTKVIAPRNGMKSTITTPVDTARLFMPDDGKNYILRGTWELYIPYDTLIVPVESIEPTDPRFKVVNMVTATNSGKPGISDKSFAWVPDASKLASGSVDFTGIMIELYSERWASIGNVHGTIQVYVDNVLKGTFNQGIAPLVTDYSRGVPTFRLRVKPGPHNISVRNTGSGQFMIDNFRVYNYKLQPKP